MDKSWMSLNRFTTAYGKGVESFMTFAKKKFGEHNPMPCPCKTCGNLNKFVAKDVEFHLFYHGVDGSYTKWIWHGEKSPGQAPSSVPLDRPTHHHFGSEALGDDALADDTTPPDDAASTIKLAQTACDQYSSNPEKFQKILEEAEEPLYKGCPKFTKLSAVVTLFNEKAKSGWSDISFSRLLKIIGDMLPDDDNLLPRSMREVKKTLSVYGMSYEKIDACPNDCVLYRKGSDNENKTNCPTCGESRYKVNKNLTEQHKGVPAKVLWYFPPIPRFKKLFQSVQTSKHMTWHADKREVDDKLRHPADSPAWKLVDDKWPEFGQEPRNLRLALSADGVNPHGSMSSKYSCWPVMLVTYNLPPWLYMKRKFVMLTMLISGPRQPGNDIDVYLQPLIDDLRTLWDTGVKAYDAYRQEAFTLRAVLLWTINDLPAYGNLSGCVVKGYHACPVCGEETQSCRLKHSRKNLYMAHRMYLPEDHPFRKQKKAFNGEQELQSAPIPLTSEKVAEKVDGIKTLWGKPIQKEKPKKKKKKSKRSTPLKRKRMEDVSDDGARICWKKKSIFFNLIYWEYLLLWHNLDVMHIEKNVCESLIGTLLNIPGKTKDGLNSRLDLQEMGLRDELVPDVSEKKAYLPPACYSLSKEEKFSVCETLHKLTVPDGYSSNFRALVSMQDLKLGGVKSHDCHVFMQQLLPVAIRSVLPKHVRIVLIKFCSFFHELCAKVVDVLRLLEVQKNLVVTLCLLEKYFPPSFFDVMVHLTVHLVREVQLGGPVCFRWMYGFERYMSVLKGQVRNRYRPEGCMAECYIAEEAVEFCSEFFFGLDAVGISPIENNTPSEIVTGKNPPGGDFIAADVKSLEQAHCYVLHNTSVVQPYIERHMNHLKKTFPRQSKVQKWLQDEHNRSFSSWLKNEVFEDRRVSGNKISEILRWVSQGPRIHVMKYHGYTINGCHFTTKDRDASRVSQNSGVSLVATAMHVSSAKDKNPVFCEAGYYGVIKEIWLIDYGHFKIPVFKCDWVDNKNGFKVDELGFTIVDLSRIGYKSDSFILASQAKKVFYVPDPVNQKWSIALAAPQRTYHADDNEEDLFDAGIEDHTRPEVVHYDEPLDAVNESEKMYTREDVEGIWTDNDI